VFFIVMKRVTPAKLISFVDPRVMLEDVTNGIAETWYAGTKPSWGYGLLRNIMLDKYYTLAG